jgi:transcriptional regulator with XRE-family HTH domain
MVQAGQAAVGEQLRNWRQMRRMSQLDLALDADISARHLSFVETGRSQPSRDMILRLAERLAIPLRHRNALLLGAGFAPAYRERPLEDPALVQARAAVERILEAHEPFPALAVDRHWTMLAHNRSVGRLLAAVSPALLAPPVNVLRLSLHPQGLAPMIVNVGEWKAHLLDRLRGQVAASADPVLEALARELEAYPAPGADRSGAEADVFVPLVLRTDAGDLSFFSTTTMFGTPVDITLAEIAVEAFFPADAATAEALRQLQK